MKQINKLNNRKQTQFQHEKSIDKSHDLIKHERKKLKKENSN